MKTTPRKVSKFFRPSLELLEERLAPASYTVNTLADPAPNTVTWNAYTRGACSLRWALTDLPANEQNLVWFPSSLSGTINLASSLPEVVNKSVDIIGPGRARIVVAANTGFANPFRVFAFRDCSNILIGGITIMNGGTAANGDGAAIRAINCTTVTISGCRFLENQAQDAGGALFLGDVRSSAVYDSYFYDNKAFGLGFSGGGAIYSGGRTRSVTIQDSIFLDNHATRLGGAIRLSEGIVNITDSAFLSNQATRDGGAVDWTNPLVGNTDALNISRSSFTLNSAGRDGGAIHVNGVTGTIRGTFRGNTAVGNGGAIDDPAGNLNTMGATITSNSALSSPLI